MPSAARARVSPLRLFGSLTPGWAAAEESVGDALDVKASLLLRGRESRHQPGPPALRLLHDTRHVLDEEKPGSSERLGVTPDELHIPGSVAVALGHARSR